MKSVVSKANQPLRRTNAMIIDGVFDCIFSVWSQPGGTLSTEGSLRTSAGLDGHLLLMVSELLEEEFGIAIRMSELIDLAWRRPKVIDLVNLVRRKLIELNRYDFDAA